MSTALPTRPRPKHDEIRRRLRYDTPFWAKTCAKIIDRDGELSELEANGPQLRLDEALEDQRKRNEPMRAIVLKARKLGFSTWVQARLIQRVTQFSNRNALVVAQDSSTATELFKIGQLMHSYLPDVKEDPYDDIKPRIRNRRAGRVLIFGETSTARQEKGLLGVNSTYSADTAREVEAGRGYTFHYLHLSEVAFWPDPGKLTALLNAVPQRPETMVVIESTANGLNHFKDRWDDAMDGRSSYAPIFAAWHEEPSYRTEFRNSDERMEFINEIGTGPFGEDEPRLIERFDCTPEQLAWRRRMIVDACESDVRIWKQEYPASPDEAFMSTGNQVFSGILVQRVLDRVEGTDPLVPSKRSPGPARGVLRAADYATRKIRERIIRVPTAPLWIPEEDARLQPREPIWRVWEEPQLPDEETGTPTGRYVVAVDPAGGEQTDAGDHAFSAIQVVNHRTLEQCAEWRGRIDPDLVGMQAYLVALYYNKAWLVVERTGGYGLSMIRMIWRDFKYPLTYTQRSLDKKKEPYEDRLGWDTNRASKVLLEDGARELLREGTHGINSRTLAHELTTYVQNEKGKTGPEKNKFADCLMAWMIAEQVAHEKVVAPERAPGNVTTTRPQPRFASTGY